MKKLVAMPLIVALAIAVPALVGAAGGPSSGTTPINCQSQAWTTTPVATSSSAGSSIPALALEVTANFPLEITLSVRVSGAPVAFEIQDTSVAGRHFAAPAAATFAPTPSSASFSYTWVDASTGAAAEHGHSLKVLWKRNASSGTSVLHSADVVVTYETDVCTGAN
jgi:hypothetical protein